MRFLARWLGQSILMAAALCGFFLAVQAPAWTEHYIAALQQRAQELQLDIDGRIETVRRYYALDAALNTEEVRRLLTEREPANAAALRAAELRRATYENAHTRLTDSSAMLRPLLAARLVVTDAGALSAVADSAFANYTPRLPLTLDALAYGVLGLVLALFLVELLFSLLRGLAGDRAGDRARDQSWRRRIG